MQRIIAIALICLSTTVFAQKKLNVEPFHAVHTAGSVDVKLVKSNKPSVEYKITKGDESDLEVRVVNGRLKIEIERGFFWFKNTKAEVTVYYTQLDAVKASAGSSIETSDCLYATEMELSSSSGASMNVKVDVGSLDVDCSSGASIMLSGYAKNTKMGASSGASISGSKFESDIATAKASSGAHCDLIVKSKIDASASSGGSVEYGGLSSNGNVTRKTSSGGSVSRRN